MEAGDNNHYGTRDVQGNVLPSSFLRGVCGGSEAGRISMVTGQRKQCLTGQKSPFFGHEVVPLLGGVFPD